MIRAGRGWELSRRGRSQSGWPGKRGPGTKSFGWCLKRISSSALCVPFPSSLEAEIACGSLAPDAEPHGGAVEKQLTVSGSVMAV